MGQKNYILQFWSYFSIKLFQSLQKKYFQNSFIPKKFQEKTKIMSGILKFKRQVFLTNPAQIKGEKTMQNRLKFNKHIINKNGH